MKITFLGTGNAWGLNELSPDALSQAVLTSTDPRDRRLRTSIYIEIDSQNILVDCGPDFSQQRRKYGIASIDALLITHTHSDHIGGLDDLKPYKRARTEWSPIPAYAHPDAWKAIKEGRGFGYLVGTKDEVKVLEERTIESGIAFSIGDVAVTPFKTLHDQLAPGSVGYILDAEGKRIVYTSDFWDITDGGERIKERPIDILIIETNGFNEPDKEQNRHMSFQRAIEFIKKWNPSEVYFVHFGDEDQIPNDPWNSLPGKCNPKNPLPYDVPKTHQEWDRSVRAAFSDYTTLQKYCSQKDIVAYDGLKITK
jgi:phosphoribosyl 1,2-cyclic phosphate phosphodiesterase